MVSILLKLIVLYYAMSNLTYVILFFLSRKQIHEKTIESIQSVLPQFVPEVTVIVPARNEETTFYEQSTVYLKTPIQN